jgi:cell wall-associated NlpC family hydrolase
MFANRITDFLDDKHYNRLQPLRVQAKPGDVLAFWIDKAGLPRHVAVYMGENEMGQTMILHAFVKGRHCVVEMPMDGGFWLQRIWGLFEVPGLED